MKINLKNFKLNNLRMRPCTCGFPYVLQNKEYLFRIDASMCESYTRKYPMKEREIFIIIGDPFIPYSTGGFNEEHIINPYCMTYRKVKDSNAP